MNNNLKPVKYWLCILPKSIKEKWLMNYDPDFASTNDLETFSNHEFMFSDFLAYSFDWSKTNYHYWLKIESTDPSEFIIQKREESINTILND